MGSSTSSEEPCHDQNMKAPALPIWFGACLFCGVCARSADDIPSWNRFEEQLGKSVVVESFRKHLNKNSTFQKLVATRQVDIFVEMSAQTNSLALQVVGLCGVLEIAPRTGLDIALKLALAPGSERYALELYPLLNEIPMEPGFNDALTYAFRTSPIDVPAATTLVELLPEDRLRQWFEDAGRSWVVPTYEAITLGRLYSALNRQKKPATPKMKETLAKFAKLPGMPRVVYLEYATESEPEYAHLMKLALEDDALLHPTLLGLTRTKAAFISQNINVSALSISEERRKVISSAVAKYANSIGSDGKNPGP